MEDDDVLLWLIEFGLGIVLFALDISFAIAYAFITIGWNILFGGDD